MAAGADDVIDRFRDVGVLREDLLGHRRDLPVELVEDVADLAGERHSQDVVQGEPGSLVRLLPQRLQFREVTFWNDVERPGEIEVEVAVASAHDLVVGVHGNGHHSGGTAVVRDGGAGDVEGREAFLPGPVRELDQLVRHRRVALLDGDALLLGPATHSVRQQHQVRHHDLLCRMIWHSGNIRAGIDVWTSEDRARLTERGRSARRAGLDPPPRGCRRSSGPPPSRR